MNAKLVITSTLFFVCVTFNHGFGQTMIRAATMSSAAPIQIQEGLAIPAVQATGNPAVPAAAATGSPDANAAVEETPEQKKVKLLLKEKFDRTTSAVLKAWSDKPETKENNEGDKEKPVTAVIKNAFEGFVVMEFDSKPSFKANDVVSIKMGEEEFGRWKLLSVDGNKVSAQQIEAKPVVHLPKNEPAKAVKGNAGKQANVPVEESKSDTTSDKNTESANQQNENAKAPKTKTEAKSVTKLGTAKTVEKAAKKDQESSDAKQEKAGDDVQKDSVKNSKKELATGDEIFLIDPKTLEQKPDVDKEIEREVKLFARDVVLGNWGNVKSFLAELKEEDADKVYAHMLKSLGTAPRRPGAQPGRGQQPPKPQLSPEDILQIADASPVKIRLKTKADEKEDKAAETSNEAKTAVAGLPAGIELPPGVSVNDLPPEALQALAARSGAGQAVAKSSNSPKGSNHILALATLIRNSKSTGHDFQGFYEKVKAGTTHFGGDDPIKRLTAAELFMKSSLTQYVEEFLPKLDDETTKTNIEALKIWSQLALAMHSKKRVAEWLEKAWQINQWIIAIEDVEKADKDYALSNLISLSSKIEKEVGVKWMNDSFTELPERGMTILTNLGTKSADMAMKAAQTPESTRLDLLRLQNEAVEKLIKISPDQAKSWKSALTLLAQNWLLEAATSLQYSQQNSGRSYMEIDMYGNYYWVNSAQRQQMYGGNNRRPRPIKTGDVLEIAPSSQWQAIIDPTLHTNLRQTKAKLHLRINEENKAFPYIEEIAETNPEMARDLVHEFLRIWTQNHDPNSNKRQRNPYIYFYGFDQKAEAIPLTRSKQERNLEELQEWVNRIRKLPIEDIEEQRLADAFTTCHSSAEVFKLERFRDVFGDFGKLKPKTIAAICEKMRANLASNWRDIRNQEQKQTKRREPEVQKEVLEGYQTAMQLCEEAMVSEPESWPLHLVKAKLMYDQNAYSQTVQKSSEFSDKRDAAFEQFILAAEKYAAIVDSLEQKDQSTDVYDYWFYASLGAVDLGKITDKTVPDLRQYAKIRAAIEGLAPDLSEWHMSKFANNLFTRMSPIKPEIKFRYLRGGFEIVGDHPRAWEAKNLFDYYKDLVSEIKLIASIDGDDKIGQDQTFGVYVNLLHTNEIERESGGFGKYVQNQNSMMYAYNYGRPTENYRDKFNDSVEMALGEHFEVISVTFQAADSMKSRPDAKIGWRVTPYAYVLLKPKGPEVDRIAPLKLDLDFLDTSGYVVIPVESPALVVDCSEKTGGMRPVSNLEITQTLDERQAGDGKLIVEVSASAEGLVPDLEEIIDVDRENFELVSVDDQGVLPTSFDKESEGIQILSDRSWTVEYKAKETENKIIDFAFSDSKLDGTNSKFQRYEDADLVEVAKSVKLEKNYKATSLAFLYWLIPMVAIGLFGLAGLIYIANQPDEVARKRFEMPEDVNPFTVLTLLKDIKARNGISNEKGIELQNSIERIEKFYFGDDQADRPDDLEELAKTWVRQAT